MSTPRKRRKPHAQPELVAAAPAGLAHAVGAGSAADGRGGEKAGDRDAALLPGEGLYLLLPDGKCAMEMEVRLTTN